MVILEMGYTVVVPNSYGSTLPLLASWVPCAMARGKAESKGEEKKGVESAGKSGRTTAVDAGGRSRGFAGEAKRAEGMGSDG